MRHISRVNINTDTYTYIWIEERKMRKQGNENLDVIHKRRHHERGNTTGGDFWRGKKGCEGEMKYSEGVNMNKA